MCGRISDIEALRGTFVVCHELTVEHDVHFSTVVSFYDVSHSLEYYTADVLEKSSRFDVVCVYHCLSPVNMRLSKVVSISRKEVLQRYCHYRTHHRNAENVPPTEFSNP